ncbi:hypothetical protein JEQ12_019814 [Ovis aries]|uniref:MAGE domain-containing protein n=1 Tax=Ovis aries TaxID=9940 RepID=A0A835ZI31_SHEEP|nr:hypothetical protein JEQ12_019814 [Ovis aries]
MTASPMAKSMARVAIGNSHSGCPNLLSIGPDSCLRSLTTAIMPRGQKSKHRAREKRRQARAETQGLHDQATTSGEEETTSSSPPDSESAPSSSSAAGTSKGPQGAQGTTSAAAGAEGQVREGENSSQASAAAENSHTDLLTWKAEMLVQYMLCKYKMRALIKRSEMLKAVTRRYREQFPEILSQASERMEMVFGLVLKEVRPNSHCYTLVSNLDLSDSESMRGDWGLPKNGLLMPLLGVIYLNGNHAPEEKIWKFLNMLGIYDGRSHFIFGEPRKLITEDLVREGYLEYRQVPGSDPPRYEFLWGPKLLTETSKTKVLQFLAKVKDSGHTAFLPQNEDAWREEVESTGDRGLVTWVVLLTSSQRITWRFPNLLSIGADLCLRSLTTAIMPRGQKSKHRAREKHRQARAETQGLHDQATTSGGEETTSSSPPDSESGPSSSSAAGTSKGPQGAQGTTSAAAGAEGQVREGENSSQASAAAESSHTDLLTWKAEMLVQYMLCKYKMRALIKRSEMLKAVTRRYREQFPEILSRASERMEMVFGLVLKEVRPNSHCYTLVSNLDLSDSESMRGDWGLPKNGLLMPLLGVIYLNGNHAPEEKIWKFLNMLGIYDGRSHFIFGEPRKLITEDLVREGYLEYRQVPGSDPPRYEFLWGPKLLTETSKTKVLQFLAKVKDSGHTAFLTQYEDAWREEVESTGDRAKEWMEPQFLGGDILAITTGKMRTISANERVSPTKEEGSQSGAPPVKERCSEKLPESPLGTQTCPNLLSVGPDSCLRSLTTAIMPRGQKSKHRAREKRRQARAETQGLHDQATTSGGEETTSSSPPDSESGPSSSSAAGTSKGPQGAQGTTSAATGAVRKRSGVGHAAPSRSGVGAEGQVREGENSSQASAAAESSHTDLLTWKAEVLVQYMLCKYKMRALIKRSEMLKAVTRRYREQFPEILSRASERMELVFGLVLKEVRPNSHCYTLVSNLDLSDSESMRGDWGLPKNGLLMPLLGVIYLNGNHAPEEKIWNFLNMLGIYDGRSHFIFGEPRKLITEDLVREGYLEYRQVPGSDPPRYEFLWGPKLLTETSKMKVLQFLAKVKDSGHTAFLSQYEDAWREEVESTGDRGLYLGPLTYAMDFLSLITPRTRIPSLRGLQERKYSEPSRDVAFPKKALIKGARAFRKTPMQLD